MVCLVFVKVSENNGIDISSKSKSSTASIGNSRKIYSTLTTTVSGNTAGYYHCHVTLNAHVKTAVFIYTKNTTIDRKFIVMEEGNSYRRSGIHLLF